MDLYYNLVLSFELRCVGEVGGYEVEALAFMEPLVKYHPAYFGTLTLVRYPDQEQRQAGSLTGAVAS